MAGLLVLDTYSKDYSFRYWLLPSEETLRERAIRVVQLSRSLALIREIRADDS